MALLASDIHAVNELANPFRNARFLLGAHAGHQLPTLQGYEVAFAGRSNTGKSSVINAVVDNRRLARTSKIPGRTQQVNFFQIDPGRVFVDLPGYGFARVPLRLKQHWSDLMEYYFRSRSSICGLVIIMDIRRPLTPFDQQMLAWGSHACLPMHIVLNKADKLSRGAGRNRLSAVQSELNSHNRTSAQLCSAVKGNGIEPLRQVLASWLYPEA